jgi:hypothetical protein
VREYQTDQGSQSRAPMPGRLSSWLVGLIQMIDGRQVVRLFTVDRNMVLVRIGSV